MQFSHGIFSQGAISEPVHIQIAPVATTQADPGSQAATAGVLIAATGVAEAGIAAATVGVMIAEDGIVEAIAEVGED